MSPSVDFGPLDRDRELLAAGDVVAQSFALAPAEGPAWLEKSGLSHVRVLRERGEVAATLLYVHMGQWFGGRRVPTTGIAGVGVAPAHRGRGAATRLMQAGLRELHARGVPLATLYPATQPLYRRVGFEVAGSRFEVRVPGSALALRERALTLRPIAPADALAVQAAYRRHAQLRPGLLDRGDYVWNRVLHPRGETAYGYLVEDGSQVEGYLYLTRRRQADLTQELALPDLVALTPRAARRLLSFLGDHRSLARDVVWHAGPQDPMLLLLEEQSLQVKLVFQWMVRLLDVPAALVARGYPAAARASLHLEVEDALLPHNSGRFLLEVEDGTARVRPGGEGRLRLDVRALAPLYTGHLSPAALQAVGALEADEGSLAQATALFAGPAPTMTDMF
nr:MULTISPECIES: GNAT family N-acetyltransferase [Myxococcaceae]